MNVYDWDNTIYRGDSTVDFVGYCFTHYPKTLLNLPRIILYGSGYLLKIVSKQRFKENLYHMFVYIEDMPRAVDKFTSTHLNHVKEWYLRKQEETDIVISASPEFLIQSFCKKINISMVLASPVNIKNGKYKGKNCHGEEKVKRFYSAFPNAKIDEFYSDSLSDTPLALISKKAFIVKGNERKDWPK